ncbi:hypothetical protein AB4452_23120 [Vibrio lentus]
MPELNPTGYAKQLNSGNYEQLPIISEQYDVVDDAGIPIPLRMVHHQRDTYVSDAETPDGVIIIFAIDFEELDSAIELLTQAQERALEAKDLYDYVVENYDGMYEENVIGRIAFNILPGPISVKELTVVPRICGAYIKEKYRRYRISPIGYQMLGHHYGAVQSDQEQTPLGAKLWYASLPKFGKVVAVDTKIESILEEVLHTCPPTGEYWDGTVLVNTDNEKDLSSLGKVPYSLVESKKHVVFEFVPLK